MHKLADQDYTDGFTTDLTKIQEQILTFVEDMQPVCRKIIKMNADSYAESTVNEHLNKLEDRALVKKNENGAYFTT